MTANVVKKKIIHQKKGQSKSQKYNCNFSHFQCIDIVYGKNASFLGAKIK
jgi:hypothetical protein